MLVYFSFGKTTREPKLTEKANGANDVGSINAKSQQQGVDKGVERGGESSTAEEGADTLRGIGLRALHGEVGFLGQGGYDTGADDREDGKDRESHFVGFIFFFFFWSFGKERSGCYCSSERIAMVDGWCREFLEYPDPYIVLAAGYSRHQSLSVTPLC